MNHRAFMAAWVMICGLAAGPAYAQESQRSFVMVTPHVTTRAALYVPDANSPPSVLPATARSLTASRSPEGKGGAILVLTGALLGELAAAAIADAATADRRIVYGAAAIGAGGGGILGAAGAKRKPAPFETLIGGVAGAVPLLALAVDDPRGEVGLNAGLDIAVAAVLPFVGALLGNVIGQ